MTGKCVHVSKILLLPRLQNYPFFRGYPFEFLTGLLFLFVLLQLKKYCNCTVVKFPFQSLPLHFQKLKTCTWKPLVIKVHAEHNNYTSAKGDGVAQWVERRTRDPENQGSYPVRSTSKNCESFSESKMLCCLVVCVLSPRVHVHA